jgi:hypothetical protein
MPKFKVATPIMRGGKLYSAGDTIELEKDEARTLGSALENPPGPEKGSSKELEAALQSQRDRPNSDIADFKVSADVQAARRAARESGKSAASAASESVSSGLVTDQDMSGPPTAPAGPSNPEPPGPGGDDKKVADKKK